MFLFNVPIIFYSGWHGWLRQYATSRKVAGAIPDDVNDPPFPTWPSPSKKNMALGLTQPLTETSTSILPVGKTRSACKAEIRTAICEWIVQKMWNFRRHTTAQAYIDCYRNIFTFHFYFIMCFFILAILGCNLFCWSGENVFHPFQQYYPRTIVFI
jgi:hypothetical protein